MGASGRGDPTRFSILRKTEQSTSSLRYRVITGWELRRPGCSTAFDSIEEKTEVQLGHGCCLTNLSQKRRTQEEHCHLIHERNVIHFRESPAERTFLPFSSFESTGVMHGGRSMMGFVRKGRQGGRETGFLVSWDVDSRDCRAADRVRYFVFDRRVRSRGRSYGYAGFVFKAGVRYLA